MATLIYSMNVSADGYVEDAEGRRALWERLQFALDGEPDPWFELSRAKVDERQFIPIAVAREQEMA